MAAPTSRNVLSLYKEMMRASEKFSSYNYKSYAMRKVAHSFRQNKGETEPNKIAQLYSDAVKNLEIIQRQVVIGGIYTSNKSVIETNHKH
ncbi:PREDICTED: LYR motif-containing protein 4-like [Priapulus caudatus]|uniref:LYR motif-containing protein 4-like n=1 Tax=Priapulus caudatus TaxID=37621 RepID=A0ABM1EIN2_PRICU|nr:PREDICTED: LYR motif-containing protein 4-like [Priapulus caudatus]